ncbi:MAG: hypothetical protein HYZ42_00830 [Bacteroidetes bacterium]|nr:hypothetical protein [Bacteroidota bacterium]
MKKYIFSCMMITVVIGSLSLQSCNKDKWNAEDSQTASDNSLTEATADDIFKQADEAATEGTSSLKAGDFESLNGPCATVTHDSLSNPRKVTIDFGSTNCTGNDGKARRGKIIVTYTGKYRAAGTVITVTTDNYFVNDNQVILTKTITNNGRNASGFLTWNISVVGGKIVLANNGGTITWTVNHTRTWIAGENSRMLRDNKYEITGSSNGTDKNGVSYSVVISTPILVDFSCNASKLVKGVMEITPSGKTARVIDFGNGSCDDDATITVGKTTKNFKLKK